MNSSAITLGPSRQIVDFSSHSSHTPPRRLKTKAFVNAAGVAKLMNLLLFILTICLQITPHLSQLIGSEKTMEQFLDRLLHESIYDRRIRPFYTDSKSKYKRFKSPSEEAGYSKMALFLQL